MDRKATVGPEHDQVADIRRCHAEGVYDRGVCGSVAIGILLDELARAQAAIEAVRALRDAYAAKSAEHDTHSNYGSYWQGKEAGADAALDILGAVNTTAVAADARIVEAARALHAAHYTPDAWRTGGVIIATDALMRAVEGGTATDGRVSYCVGDVVRWDGALRRIVAIDSYLGLASLRLADGPEAAPPIEISMALLAAEARNAVARRAALAIDGSRAEAKRISPPAQVAGMTTVRGGDLSENAE